MRMKAVIWVAIFVLNLNAKGLQKYVLPCNSDLLLFSRKILFEQVGTLEERNLNDGKEIEKYLKTLGLPKGSPYCVAGQYYCFFEAARRLSFDPKMNPMPRTGLSIKLYYYARKLGMRKKFEAELDDLIIWHRSRALSGHTERVVKVQRKGWVETIGFNTKRYESESGIWCEGVFRWRRNLFHPLGNMNLLGIVGFTKAEDVY